MHSSSYTLDVLGVCLDDLLTVFRGFFLGVLDNDGVKKLFHCENAMVLAMVLHSRYFSLRQALLMSKIIISVALSSVTHDSNYYGDTNSESGF